jgi:signal peptidase II
MKTKYYLIALLVLISDHLTKWIVRTHMEHGDVIEIIPNYLRLSYVKNSGVAFGLFSEIQSVWKPYLLAGMAAVAVIIILIYSARMPLDRIMLQIGLAITMGGIIGNFADRIFGGYVVDFIEFHIRESFHWPTFNLADSAITIGIALLLIDTVRSPGLDEDLQRQAPE